ncbi:PAAR domain-containing protein [Dyella sp. M7H15-1]|uniref:PAAR domain-containing protein n=1 Tax=Dyella sp. M7H15-1 TaxID=2501295 RepID=UPI0010051C63|nr:PAAR domain-containing protein [Dyella sp. M7H15-1]QAU24421.1 PAAR domain-containing protein [Dyella sp. M7H15-1]
MDFIRINDTTTGGGKVISASGTMRYDERLIARKGDRVTCQKHPDVQPNLILEGDETMTEDGVPLARHNHRVSCGCRLISSLR